MACAQSSPSEGGDSVDKFLPVNKPIPGVKYPIQVQYVDVCDGWPLEYCEYHPHPEKAKKWMEENLPSEMQDMYLISDEKEEVEKKKRQTRGGRGAIKTKKEVEKKISLARAPRGKKKFVTVITGLTTYDISLKDASKYFANKFSTGSSVTGDDEIVIQGDVKDDLWDMITEKWPQIDEDDIDDLGDQKR